MIILANLINFKFKFLFLELANNDEVINYQRSTMSAGIIQTTTIP